ncbi:hypothetical protein [Streptomyces sp. NPDC012888]|uniref:hypothetical protein n=1 Tax=Streptomyces sp. NPDC012888 TaxID=3364855 RepID=UPI0036CB5A1E
MGFEELMGELACARGGVAQLLVERGEVADGRLWIAAAVSRADRNAAGDWSPDSTLTDDVYNRPDGTIDTSKHDPLDAVPLHGG